MGRRWGFRLQYFAHSTKVPERGGAGRCGLLYINTCHFDHRPSLIINTALDNYIIPPANIPPFHCVTPCLVWTTCLHFPSEYKYCEDLLLILLAHPFQWFTLSLHLTLNYFHYELLITAAGDAFRGSCCAGLAFMIVFHPLCHSVSNRPRFSPDLFIARFVVGLQSYS